jgi:hypothetical protein
MRSHSFWAIAAVLALTAAARADDTYTIKLKHSPDVGKTVTVKDTDSNTSTTKIFDADGKALGEEMKKTQKDEQVYAETVLARGDKHPTKYKRTYEKATRTQDGKMTARSFEGLTLVFEEKDDKFTVTVEGDKPIDKADLAELTRKANESEDDRDEVFLPGKPVKVGDTWKIDGKALAKAFAKTGGLDPEHSSGVGKLVKAYKKDGRQHGVIEMTLKMAPDKTPPGVKFDKPPVLEAKITLDTAIDGSTTAGVMTMTGGTAGKATVEQNGQKFNVELKTDLSGKQERSAEK